MDNKKADNLRLAIFSITTAVLALSLGDAVIKLMSVSFSLWQLYVVRSLIAIAMMFCIIRVQEPGLVLKPVSIRWTAVRSLLLCSMWIVYYVSLPHIKLSVAAAVFYTIPLFITLFSALFTGDRVTPRSWVAIIIGFVGVLIIVRPEPEGFNAYVLLPLLAAILYALAMILTRTRCLKENPKVLALSLQIAMVAVGGLGMLFVITLAPSAVSVSNNPLLFNTWVPLGLKEWLAMLVLAIAIVTGSVGTAVAYQNGPSSTVASFDYFYLGFSVLWGFLLFAEVPDVLTIIGIAMVAAAGIIALRR